MADDAAATAADKKAKADADAAAAAEAKAAADAEAKAKAASPPVKYPVGERVRLAIVFLGKDGKPMRMRPKPDAKPTWRVTQAGDALAGSLSVSSDGLSADYVIVGPGVDTVMADFTVAGVSYRASREITGEELPPPPKVEPEVLTSVMMSVPVKE